MNSISFLAMELELVNYSVMKKQLLSFVKVMDIISLVLERNGLERRRIDIWLRFTKPLQIKIPSGGQEYKDANMSVILQSMSDHQLVLRSK